MSHLQIAERWLAAEARRRPNFKQQLQNLEHGTDLGQSVVENEIESLLSAAVIHGTSWLRMSRRICLSPVSPAWTAFGAWFGRRRISTAIIGSGTAMKSIEVFVASEYRAKNPDAEIRLINWDLPMTHYGTWRCRNSSPRRISRGALVVRP